MVTPSPPIVETSSELQLVVFTLDKEEFGVEINNVQEIIRMPSITQVPGAQAFVEGLTNLRGKIITILNLSVIMGMERSETCEDTRIVVVNMDGVVMGFVVDSVREVLRLLAKNVEPAPPVIAGKVSAENLLGIGRMKNRLLILLNLDGVISTAFATITAGG